MTIIAGFRCHDGVVICGDTQETVQNLSKKNVTKVRLEQRYGDVSDLAVAFCGAGEGPFIDLLTRKAWESARGADYLEEASQKIEDSIKYTYQEYGQIYQPGHCPSVELIYGVKMHGDSALFSALEPVVNGVDNFKSGGIGYYMADFLSARMNNGYMSLHQYAILSAYILFQAKEHVDGCGGDSHVAVLRNDGHSGLIDQQRIKSWTALLERADKSLGRVLIESANLQSDASLIKAIDSLSRPLMVAWERAREQIRDGDEFSDIWESLAVPSNTLEAVMRPAIKRDEFGFVMPSDIQTSENQQ